jgi:hypothetical protein
MDPEIELKNLLEEENYIDSVLNSLKGLKKRKGYADLLEDTINLIDKLKERKKQIKKNINIITEEAIATAECFAQVDFDAIEAEDWH